MLFSRRKRLEELAAREAAGENLWTREFGQPARTKLVLALRTVGGRDDRLLSVRNSVRHAVGAFFLHKPQVDAETDLFGALMEGPADLIADIIEASYSGLSRDQYGYPSNDHLMFSFRVNEILAEHRISFELIEGKMVEFESKELHASIVEPTLRLLSGRAGWEGVEETYQKALKEIGDDPADAITDAGTALQEALTLLGCKGNQLGRLGKSAREKGLLASHDGKLVDWVAADRSETGDAHNARPAQPEDAWLAVHVVGALILRLTGEQRGADA